MPVHCATSRYMTGHPSTRAVKNVTVIHRLGCAGAPWMRACLTGALNESSAERRQPLSPGQQCAHIVDRDFDHHTHSAEILSLRAPADPLAHANG